MRKIVAIGPALVVLLSMAGVALLGPALIREMVFVQTEARVVLARQALQTDDILERIDAATRHVADAVTPSVVHIDVTLPIGDEDDDRFRTGSSGAGWVYDAAGHIVTNAHVVGAAESVQIEFANGRTASGKIVEADEFTDIAVIKVDPGPGVIPVSRDPTHEVRMGDRVYAFGSPFNFKFSMSEGIVSGLGRNPRTSSSSGGFTNYIQTDAAVNPGNSGGPLVNVRGELVGMNVAIATGQQFSRNDRQGQSAGISFAIPLGVIESVVEQIITTGEVRRGFLGISSGSFPTASRRVLDSDGAFVGMGVYVASVTQGQAAERAGIRPGDIITRIDGNEIREWHHLTSVVTTSRPGSEIPVELWRDGRRTELTVSLAEFPDVVLQQGAIRPALSRNGIGFDGRSTSDGRSFVIVEWIDSRRGPGQAGFRSSDRVLSINGEAIDGLGSFYTALGRADLLLGRRVMVQVQRGDEVLTLPLVIEP